MKLKTQKKFKPRILTLLFALVLTLTMIMPTFQLQVHATNDTGGNGTGSDTGRLPQSGGNYNLGSYKNTGWLVYLTDTSGSLCSEVAFVASYDRTPDLSRYNSQFWTSRIGDQLPSEGRRSTNAEWGPPFDGDGRGFGDKIKAEMLISSYSPDSTNGYYVVKKYLGDAALQLYKDEPTTHYLVLEVCGWQDIFKNTSTYETLGSAVASCSGWAKLLPAMGFPSTANRTNGFINARYPLSCRLDQDWPGLPPLAPKSSGFIPFPEILDAGYGMIAVRGDESDPQGQTTCDEPKQPAPHEPPNESTGAYKIVKTYRTVDDVTGAIISDDGSYEKEDSAPQITIEDESEYKLVAWKTSSTHQCTVQADGWHSKVPSRVKRSGTSPTTITMGSGENTLYLLLEKKDNTIITPAEGNFIISQSTISRKIKLSIPDISAGYTNIKDLTSTWHSIWHWTSCHITHKCGGCEKHSSGSHSDGTYSEWWTCPGHSCGGWGWKDQSTVFSLHNTLKDSYPDILATKGNIQAVTKTGATESTQWYRPYTRTNTGTDDKQFKDWDYACVIMRGADKLTVAKWKNNFLGYPAANTDLDTLSSSGFAIDNKANGHRKLHDYEDKFNISLNKLSNGNTDYVTTYRPTTAATGGGICPEDNCTYSLSQTLKALVKVKVETYAGKQAGTTSVNTTCDSNPSIKPTFGGTLKGSLGSKTITSYTKRRGIEVYSANIGFRPYVQMNYDLFSHNHEPYSASSSSHKTAYVLGEYDRAISVNDYAEVSWKPAPAGHPNLSLNSLQWSTHASAKHYIGEVLLVDPSVWTALPGGATLDLSIADSDRQTVMVTSYQCVVDGTGKEQIENTSGSTYTGPTIASADTAHDAYVQSVIQGLENLNVEQWAINKIDTSKDVWNISGSEPVQPGQALSMIGRSGQYSSNEWKYYLSDEGVRPEAPASEGDLDVKNNGTYMETYTFFTNTYGEIRYIVGNTSGNKTNEKAGVDITGGLDNISKQINDRTHVVDKLKDAVEQKKGNDPTGRSKTGTAWYSEAFDGITIYVKSTELIVGYIDPPQRSTVLDPRLTQEQKSQSDMFNEAKYNQSQYRTKPYSEIYQITDKVGEFKGESVLMDEMNMLFWSKPFLIPNATVDDLH